MAAKIHQTFAGADVKLLEGGKGDFVVTVNGRELWNKKKMGDEFPQESFILSQLKS